VTIINDQYPVLTSSRKGIFFQKDYYDGNQIASENNIGYNIVPYGYFTYRHMSDDEIFYFNINNIIDNGIVSTLYPVFTTNNRLDSKFLQYELNFGKEFRKYSVLQKQGGSRTYMYFNKLRDLKLTITTSLKEQECIKNLICSIDHLITLHQSKSFGHILEVIVSCTLYWEQRKLGEIVVIERGGSPRPIEKYVTESNDGLNWIKIGDAPVQGRYITKTSEKIKESGLSKTRQVFPGDLILSNSMSFGKPYIMGIEGCIHDGWLVIKNKNNVFDLKFLCHMLSTEYLFNQYKMFAAGSTVNNLNKELVGNASVRFPKMLEQKKIGQYLESLDHLITLHQLEPFQLIFKAIAYRIIDYTKSKPPSHRK